MPPLKTSAGLSYRQPRSSLLALLAMFLCAGCPTAKCPSTTRGRGSGVQFGYQGACHPIDGTYVASGGVQVVIALDSSAALEVRSSNEKIATFSFAPHSTQTTMQTGEAGDADLILLDTAGGEIDRVTVHVRNADRLTVTSGWTQGTVPVLLVGVDETLQFNALFQGNTLLGSGQISFSGTGGITTVRNSFNQALFTPAAAGVAQIVASAPTASLTIDYRIVDASMVDSVEVVPAEWSGSRDDVARVTVSVRSAGTSIYAGDCRWKFQDSKVDVPNAWTGTIGVPPAFRSLLLGPDLTYEFEARPQGDARNAIAGVPGDYHVVCDIAGREQFLHVTFK